MRQVAMVQIPKQELVSLLTRKTIVRTVIPESGLEQQNILMTPTRVETKPTHQATTEPNKSKPWAIFWFSN